MVVAEPSFITVVTGLPRSGTSMAMQMLQAGGFPLCYDEQRQADSDNPRGYFEFEPVKRTRSDSSWVEATEGRAVKVVFTLLYELPGDRDYRVIFMRRRLQEVVASQSDMLERLGTQGAGRGESELIELFQRQITKLDDFLSGQTNIKYLDVQYTQVIEDPQTAAGAINAFVGGGLDEQAMAAAVDATLYRHQAPSSSMPPGPQTPQA